MQWFLVLNNVMKRDSSGRDDNYANYLEVDDYDDVGGKDNE